MKMKTFFLKHAVAVAAIAIASLSLMSFGLEKTTDETLFFEYKPGNIADPYSKQNVENVAHWEPTSAPCPSPDNVLACTIEVPKANTIGELGLELDDMKVKLQTSSASSTPTLFRVDDTGAIGYSNPVNRATP
ncbi:hypothetical protein ORI89_04080 [Sphingobacterium sp. UT-1RO-CII-1]|uniref:hypothetical protein n=1 Tax=Sphingobacterium sp. UT-1RO-CII-1 TaxID=2995225 RepID=UPI00227A69B4|nr:hypothetical protein [Sphingobacterium sp. UT-1RO-CII-1]MCY4778818.1 hypothetical protein [Sphingobacterium sp. UT-1RO-CII-1]